MREIRPTLVTVDQLHEDAVRAKHHFDAERWRAELRPQALRAFAARTTRLRWSRALVKAIVEELYPDGLFTALVGDLDRVSRDRWPQVVAIAVALRQSWRRDGLAHLSTQLHLVDTASHTIATKAPPTITLPILWLASAPSRLSASLRPRGAGLTALTGRSGEPGTAIT